jgi:hypothetical protein
MLARVHPAELLSSALECQLNALPFDSFERCSTIGKPDNDETLGWINGIVLWRRTIGSKPLSPRHLWCSPQLLVWVGWCPFIHQCGERANYLWRLKMNLFSQVTTLIQYWSSVWPFLHNVHQLSFSDGRVSPACIAEMANLMSRLFSEHGSKCCRFLSPFYYW